LQIVLQQGLADRLIGVLAVLPVIDARQHAQDHAPHVVGEECLEGAPAAVGVERKQPH